MAMKNIHPASSFPPTAAARKPKQRTITDGCYNRDTAKPVTAKTVKLHVG